MTSQFLDAVVPAPAPTEARYIWAKVTQSSPLRIQLDGDQAPLGVTPDDLGGHGSRMVNDRVYCQILNRRLVVLGPMPGGLPVGSVVTTARSTLPPGFLWCNGAAVSRVTYAALFAAVGTTFGVGNNSTTFNVPNVVGRTVFTLDPLQTEFNALGKTGGAKTHTLTVDQMPAHDHTLRMTGDGGLVSGNWYNLGSSTETARFQKDAAFGGSGPTGAGLSGNRGGGAAHNNLPPYIALNSMIRA